MRFAPQRRALFRHLNFQKWSEPGEFCTFWLGNVLRATMACTFSTSELPKVVREWCALMCFVHFDFEMCFAPQRRALFRHRNFQKWSEPEGLCTFWLGNVLRGTMACTFSTSEPPKVARTCGVLHVFTSKCASRHNGVHFFDSATSKSGPTMVCFGHFDLEMCFAPQWRALFRHLNFQKWSEPGVFCTFWLGNVLRATTACFFSTSQLPKVVRTWCVLYILTWKCASRHNGVHFFDISTSKSGPNLVCFVHFDFEMCFAPQRRALFRHLNFQKCSDAAVFSTCWLQNVLRATTACNFSSLLWPAGSAPAALASLLFDPPEPQIIGKTQCFATFLPFRASASSFFSLFLFWSSLFYLSLLSASSLLCFSSVHIVGSLTPKLPSAIDYLTINLLLFVMSCYQGNRTKVPSKNADVPNVCSWNHLFCALAPELLELSQSWPASLFSWLNRGFLVYIILVKIMISCQCVWWSLPHLSEWFMGIKYD